MEFRTQFDECPDVYSNPGSMIKEERGPELDKYGNKVIVRKGEINLYQYIQSWRDTCDINILMAKFVNGDKTALMQKVGAYLDISDIPDNFNDMLNLTTKAQSVFDQLPIEIKQQFGNNVNNFLSNTKSEEFKDLMMLSEDDIRMDKLAKSQKFTDQAIADSKVVYDKKVEYPGIVDDGGSGLKEEVENIVYGKRSLNESK